MKEVRHLLVLYLILLGAVCWDYKKAIIPNKLIMIGAIAGLVRLIVHKEVGELLYQLLGILLPIFLFFPIYRIGGIGGGDVKIFSMLGFYLSFWQLIYTVILTFIIGAFISLIKMIYYQNLGERITYLFSYIQQIITSGTIHYYYQNINNEEKIKKTKVRLAGPILLATLITGGIL